MFCHNFATVTETRCPTFVVATTVFGRPSAIAYGQDIQPQREGPGQGLRAARLLTVGFPRQGCPADGGRRAACAPRLGMVACRSSRGYDGGVFGDGFACDWRILR